MKFKPVVASLVMLGLMTPAFAKINKNIGSELAVVNQNSVISPVCSEGWFNRISVGGIGSIVGIAGNRDAAGTFGKDKNSTDLFLNNANLLVNANLSEWSKATVNVGKVPSLQLLLVDNSKDYSVKIDEAYVTIANLAKTPFYVTVGKKYVPFGDYADAYIPAQFMSPAQMLAQTKGMTAIAGAATDFGFYASVFALKGEAKPAFDSATNVRNFGGKIGYYGNMKALQVSDASYNVALSYINNLLDSNLATVSTLSQVADSVDGISAHADLAFGPVSMYTDFVAALKKMGATNAAKIWGANVNAAYSFNTLNRNSYIELGAQFSGNAKGMPVDVLYVMPKYRFTGEYSVNIFKNTDLGFMVAYGKSFADSNNVDYTSTTGLVRLNFQF